ncbi:hypothetical protein BD414DRAFT_509774 [Trametes punicea]|nr:hypothetical protein BD414DRAFT_509774 [Trametes punicea]
MLYTDRPRLELTLDPADGSRGTPYHPSSPQTTSTAPSASQSAPSSLSLPREGRSYLDYPIPDMREVKPGVLASGQWTVDHPFVDAYLAALARLAPKQRPQQPPGASMPSTAATSPIVTPQTLPDTYFPPSLTGISTTPAHPPQREAEKLRWQAHHGGIASVHTVAQVITVQYELFPGPGSAWYGMQVSQLSEEQKHAVFALAALRVLNHPTHPAHWALWAKNVLQRTAQVVEEVFQLKPCPIVSHVGWLGLPESMWALQGLQSTFIPPPPPQAEKPKAGGMTLRKRKVPATATTTSTATSTASSATTTEEEVALRTSSRKRQRTTRAQAALAQAQAQEEEAAAASVAVVTPEEAGTTTLQDVGPQLADAPAVSKDVKQELLDIVGASPALQPLALSLAVPDIAPAPAVSGEVVSTTLSTRPRRSAPSTSPNMIYRSTRTRRKPARGPVVLSSSSSASTSLSAVSTPVTSPTPLEDLAADAKAMDAEHGRAGSCGSSTAVSDAGDASEGTAVDLDVETVDSAVACGIANGKRKAIEIEGDGDGIEGEIPVERDTEAAPVEKAQGAAAAIPGIAATTAPKRGSGGKKGRSKTTGARPKKRVKVDQGSDQAPQDAAAPASPAVLDASGEENVPPVASASAPSKKKAKSARGSAGAAKRRAIGAATSRSAIPTTLPFDCAPAVQTLLTGIGMDSFVSRWKGELWTLCSQGPNAGPTETCSFLELPAELQVRIISQLDARSILACREASAELAWTIDDSVELQYRLELALAGMVDGPPSDASVRDRLDALRAYRSAWAAGAHPVHRVAVDADIAALSASENAAPIAYVEKSTGRLRIYAPPAPFSGLAEREEAYGGAGAFVAVHPGGFAVDPERDLLAYTWDTFPTPAEQ